LRRAEEGANILGVFRVKNHYFTAKKIIVFTITEGGAKNVGVFRVKNHDFTPKNAPACGVYLRIFDELID
jgi:hypothetical protein